MAKFKLQEACNRAKEALEHGDSERAIAMCQHIVRYYPRCVEAYRLLGEAYLERGDTVTADKLFSYVVQADPQNVLAHIGRAIIREERGDIDAAISEFERAFEIDPAISELREELLRLYTSRFGSEGAKIRTSRVGLAHLYARDYLFPQAINEYHDILRSEPRLDVRVALALTLWRSGNDAAAADLCNAILQQVPNNLQANLILGQIWLAQGQRDDALALLRRAMDLDPDNSLARSIFESRAGRIMLPPLTYYAAELPKWDGSELSASSELPVGLSEVVELEEDAPPPTVEADTATAATQPEPQPMEFSAAEVGEQLATAEREVAADDLDQTPAWLLSDAPVVETAAPTNEGLEDAHPAAPELQRQRLDRSEFMQRLATAGLGATTTTDQPSASDEANVEAAAPADEVAPATAEIVPEPLDVNSTDWLEQLAARTRFDADAPMSGAPNPPPTRERGFLDELLDDEEAPAIGPPSDGMNPAPTASQQVESEATPITTRLDGALIPVSDGATAVANAVGDEGAAPAPALASVASTEEAQPEAAAQPEVSAAAINGQPRRITGPLPDLDEAQTTAPPSPAPDMEEGLAASSRQASYNPDSPLDILGLLQRHDVPDEREAHAAPTDQAPPAPTEPVAVGDPSAPLAATAPSTNLPATTPSATTSEEDTMPAPSYAEDDDQGRTFEFDWDKEGLPDYLKEFALGESTNLGSPSEPAPTSQAPADESEGLPSWLTSAPSAPSASPAATSDDGLPSWLSANTPQPAAATPPNNAATAAPLSPAVPPAPPASPATSPADLAGLPDWLTSSVPLADQPTASAASAAPQSQPPSDVDMTGLPDWLNSNAPAPATPTTPPIAAPTGPTPGVDLAGTGSTDTDGLPSWLTAAPAAPSAQNPTPAPASIPVNNATSPASTDMDGLPSWLTTAPATPTPPPAATIHSSDRADLDNMDMEGLPSWLTPTQAAEAGNQPVTAADSLDDFGLPSWLAPEPAASSAASPVAPSNLQPLTFADSGAPTGATAGKSGGQPYAAPLDDQPAPPSAAGFGNLQPFSFDDIQFTPPGDQAPATTSTPPSNLQPFAFDAASDDDLGDLEDFVDFLKPTTPSAAPAPMADIPADLKPFSFDDLDMGASAPPATSASSSFAPASQAQPFALADTTPPAAQDYALPSSLKPFSLDDFDFGAPSTASAHTSVPFAPLASDFSTMTATPPLGSSVPASDDFSIPSDLKPFSFDDFDNLAGPLPEPTAAASIPPAPPTTDLADYRLPADLRPFALEGDSAAGMSDSNEFNFAPFSFDDLLQESPPPQTSTSAAPLSMADLGLADTTPARPSERPSLLESEFEEPSNVDVRGFSWQQSANREPTAPLVTATAEDEGGSMFAKLRRRKEELERNEPAAEEPVSAVPPVGAPLSEEERNELTMMNWPMELQDMDATTAAPLSEPAMQAAPEATFTAPAASMTTTPNLSPYAGEGLNEDYAISETAAPPTSQSEMQSVGGDEFDLSGLDLSPEERAYLLGEDLPIAGLEAVRQMQAEAGTGDYYQMQQQSTPSDAQMEVAQESTPSEAQMEAAIERDFAIPLAESQAAPASEATAVASERDFAMPMPAQPMTEEQLEQAIERDFAMPMAAQPMTEEQLEQAIERDFVSPLAESQAAPAAEYQPATTGDAGVASFADQIRDALDRAGSSPTPSASDVETVAAPAEEEAPATEQPAFEAQTPVEEPAFEMQTPVEEPATPSARERWVDFLASPPRLPIEIPAEPAAAEAEAEPEFADMYATPTEEQGDIFASAEAPTAEADVEEAPATEAEVVEAEYIVIEEQPAVAAEPVPTYTPTAPPAAPAYPYVSPAASVVPPSAYVSPAPPLYMDNRPAAPTASPPPQSAPDMGVGMTAAATPPAEEALTEQIAPAVPPTPTRPIPPSYAPTLPADELNSVSALRNFVDANRDDVTARLVLARAYENNEDYDNALEQYRLIVKSKSVPAPTLEDVVSSLQDMLTVEEVGNNPRTHRVLGDAYMKQGLFQHAISQYNWLLSK